MSRVQGTPCEVICDIRSRTLTIRIPDDNVPVPVEEVIHYLESQALAARTRQKIVTIIEVVCEKGVALRLRLEGAWDYWCELDLLDALRNLFAQKGCYQCV